jgi:hypothetical protein
MQIQKKAQERDTKNTLEQFLFLYSLYDKKVSEAPSAVFKMVQDPKLYPVDWHLSHNVGLTYNDPYSRKIHLFTMSTTALQNMGIKKPIDIVAHWAICVNGWVFELGRDPTQKKKKDQYGYKATPELQFVQKRKQQGKDIMFGEIGDLVYPYSPGQIHEIGKSVQYCNASVITWLTDMAT